MHKNINIIVHHEGHTRVSNVVSNYLLCSLFGRLFNCFHWTSSSCCHWRHSNSQVQLPNRRQPPRDCMVSGEHTGELDALLLAILRLHLVDDTPSSSYPICRPWGASKNYFSGASFPKFNIFFLHVSKATRRSFFPCIELSVHVCNQVKNFFLFLKESKANISELVSVTLILNKRGRSAWPLMS